MRQIFSWILTLALVLGLAGCGQNAAAAWQEQYDLGVRYLSEGNYEEAIIAFTAAIEIDAKRPEGLIGRGDAYALLGDTEDNLSAALSDYEAAIALDETLPGGWLGLADVYIRQGDYDRAMEILREALEKTGNDQSIADKLSAMESGSFTDSAGNLRRESYYDGNGNLVWYHILTYTSEGRSASVTAYDGGGSQIGYLELSCNENGDPLVDYVTFTDTGEISPLRFTYDGSGRLVEEERPYPDGEVNLFRYEYDAQGNKSREVRCDASGAQISDTRFQYDGQGNVIREDTYSPDGTLTAYMTYTYNDAGQQLRLENHDPDGTLSLYEVNEYDAAGHKIRYSGYFGDGTLDWDTVYRYDEDGTYLGEERYDGAGNLMSSTVNER